MAGQAGRLQGQDRTAVTCPSSSHARRCLICVGAGLASADPPVTELVVDDGDWLRTRPSCWFPSLRMMFFGVSLNSGGLRPGDVRDSR
ncbi:hypothetical protein J6590_062943 [Homalodisca vitripennis]|nr:hypothetical protein J6590_062943 [Homalodisca vitripennis]